MRDARRRLLWAFGGALLVGLLVTAFALPSIARTRAIEAAKRRGIELGIGKVRLGLTRIRLEGVEARLEGVRDLRATVREVAVGWSFAGLGDIDVDGAAVAVQGSLDAVRGELEAWRARHRSGDPAAPSATSQRRITLRNVEARWTVLGFELASGAAAEVGLDAARVRVRGGRAFARLPGFELRLEGVSTEIARATGLVGSSSVDRVSLQVVPALAGAAVALSSWGKTFPDAAGAPEEPPSTGSAPSDAAHAGASGAAGSAGPAFGLIHGDAWAKLSSLHARLGGWLSRFERGVVLQASEVVVGTDRGALGPWGARLVLGEDTVSFELDPGDSEPADPLVAVEKKGRKPLVLRALVPRGAGKWTAELKVGPASLAELGVPEGALGLTGVDEASVEARGAVELDPQAKTFAADGSVRVKGAAIANARLADGVVRDLELGAKGIVASKDDLSAWSLTGGAIELGKVRLEIEGGFESATAPDGTRAPKVWVAWSVPVVACGDALTSMPKGLLARLDGMQMQGTFGAHGRLAFDARALDKTQVDLFLDQKCRVTKVPPHLSLDRFRSPFELRVYDPKGNPKTQRFGPGTPEWVSLDKISSYVVDAVTTCEDGAFYGHKGFSAAAIRSAIVANLKAGKFALGASTVTMQLAKNVFLDRRKQLSRKLEEAVLTAWLEQGLTKSEILELYLNVIEFGPNLYGIGPASWHYFGRPARDLDPLEATFLISILPSPVKRHAMWDKGQPSDGYLQYLRALLREEHRRGKLDDEELEAAVSRPLVFHKPGDPPPPPHGVKASKGPADPGSADDPGFDPVYAPAD